MDWLTPAPDDPAATLRWVRRVELAFVPFAVLVTVLLVAQESPVWWLCCAGAVLGLVSAAIMTPAIRRAERGSLDPSHWREWRSKAELLTCVTFAGMAGVAVVLGYAFAGAQLAIILAIVFAASSAAAFAVRRRAGSPRR
jgi:FtsH-binding integral membrane protein